MTYEAKSHSRSDGRSQRIWCFCWRFERKIERIGRSTRSHVDISKSCLFGIPAIYHCSILSNLRSANHRLARSISQIRPELGPREGGWPSLLCVTWRTTRWARRSLKNWWRKTTMMIDHKLAWHTCRLRRHSRSAWLRAQVFNHRDKDNDDISEFVCVWLLDRHHVCILKIGKIILPEIDHSTSEHSICDYETRYSVIPLRCITFLRRRNRKYVCLPCSGVDRLRTPVYVHIEHISHSNSHSLESLVERVR